MSRISNRDKPGGDVGKDDAPGPCLQCNRVLDTGRGTMRRDHRVPVVYLQRESRYDGQLRGCYRMFANSVGEDLAMSDATVRGVIHLIEETKTYGQKGFRKRLVVLEQDNQRFTNYVPLEFIQDGCDSVDELNVGDEIEVRYRLSGRRWQKDASSEVKFFLNAEAISFKVLSEKSGSQTAKPSEASVNDGFSEAADDDDEAPF